jgi:hypothetical protein
MLNEILFVASLYITRIVLPIIATWILGGVIERALNRAARANA